MKTDNGLLKIICYLGIFVLLLFIILPPLFRVLFKEEEEVVIKKEPVKMSLSCSLNEAFSGYNLKTTINNNYVDEVIKKSTFIYEVEINDENLTIDDVVIEEYDDLKKISNIDFSENDNKFTLNIDYNKFDYTDEELLADHQNRLNKQKSIYIENGFECTTKGA